MNEITIIESFDDLKAFAMQIATQLKIGDVLCLRGQLGAGKTTLAGYIINDLLPTPEDVTSPTFNLVHTYKCPNFTIWHFDLYRLNNANEVYELGIEDALLYGVSIIEWPQIIEDILPINTIFIDIEFTNAGNSRKITVHTKITQA